ncbi:hypothetical protein CRE_06145 [Caenorhabditis remanei]|uniref:Protein HIRA-like C-terminal domain-containing protein n=1 Tax=Caenorhabditis remanei TaxID=31234 RepID=E3NEG0_CAERE|nr:hypothetical protein CRE_06145 [Caenorhabditis remanei]
MPKESEAKTMEKKMMEERNKQIEVRKDGKRRIQPVFCGTTAADTPSVAPAPEAKKTSTVAPPPAKKKAPAPVRDDEEDLEDSSDSDDDDEEESEDSDDMETSDVESSRKRKTATTTSRVMLAMDLKKPVLRPLEPKTLKVTDGDAYLDAPEQQPRLSQHVQERKGMFVEVDNRWKHGGIETTQIRLVKKKQTEEMEDDEEERRRTVQECIWMAVVGAPVIMVAANKYHVMLGCGDKCIRAYRTICGTYTLSVRLGALPVMLGLKENAAYVVTQTCRLSTWNLKQGKAVVARESLLECLETSTQDNNILSVDVSESGVPLVVFTNGSIFTFNVSLSCWIPAISTNILARLTTPISDAQLEISNTSSSLSVGPLVRLLKRMRRQTTAVGVAPQVVKAVKESQLEQLLHCAEQLGNPHDYQTILMLYVETLCQGGSEKKLKNILNELSRSGAPMQVCGLRRAALCDDVTRMIKLRQPAIADRIVAGGTATATTSTKNRSLF